ncbi:MAG TPA: TonB-dependent receptor [Sphingobium sp.]|uniref:TonB-dependent receptor plug domain-containing protein n=1 Tax=unclassified Sphingobium TaxID=2611147 RepID=UPI0007F3BF81|nr:MULTISPECIES: TonB-dependent receptor [unclassified Sphingobium]OAN55535.1 TonB-dependent receptor [Sphingobium sp. TCM1]HAF41577.1 TonB-dependent receptor [Sphingobium sp.]
MTRLSALKLSLIMASSWSACAMAQEAPQEPQADDGAAIIVTGTRAVGMQAAESAAPIQVLGEEALTRVGQPNLNQALTQLVPSFQAQTQGTDMASFSLSARLRGLSPNHTLVLVNGKRRHGNSILQVINGAFGGSAAPSIDLIPPDIVSRIEVLQDGAAAQYGSDAIAGVINIILKDDKEGGTIKLNAGQYYDGEGTTYSASGNFGMKIGEDGYLDVSLFHRRSDWTTIGDGQISVMNYNGTTVTNVSPAFKPLLDACNADDCTANVNGGQPASKLTLGFYNFGYDFGGVELYSFGDVSYRHGDALQGYRHPTRLCRAQNSAGVWVATTTDPTQCFGTSAQTGLVPHIEVKQNEFQITNGLRGDLGDGWNWDLAASYSEDVAKVYTTHSVNASLFVNTGQSPSDFYDGKFEFRQYVGTADIRKEFDIGLDKPLNLAFGAEYRRESYTIGQGDPLSLYIEGGQSFPGYAASDAGTLRRTAKAIYADVSFNPTPEWLVDVAGRYEHYSDFGDTQIGKITTRYDFSDAFALRGTASTGFRAPSLQESGYSSTNVGPTSATLQLAPSSPGSASAGFGALKPEKSVNLSAGIVLRPIPRLAITLDGYYIKIKDRIVSSGSITGQQFNGLTTAPTRILTPLINGLTPYDLVQAAIAASGKQLDPTVISNGSLAIQTFTNGIDTSTKGLEIAARYPVNLDFGKLDLSLGANYNVTKVTKNKLGTLFSPTAEQTIEAASPKFKGTASALFTSGRFGANLRMNYYTKVNSYVQPNSTSSNGNASRGIAALPAPILLANGQRYYNAEVKPAAIFDLELDYDITEFANIAIGANNLFDKKPEIAPLVGNYDPATWPTTGNSPYINNGGTINAPYTFGPYGTNGGYYYARATIKF